MESRSAIQAVPDRLGVVLYAVRWIIIIGVLLESRLGFTSARLDRPDIVMAAAGMAVLTIVASVGWKGRKVLAHPTLVLVGDLAFVSLIVYSSDGLQSPFYPLYYIVVTTAAVSISTRAAVTSAICAALILVGIEVVQRQGPLDEVLVLDDAVRTFPYLFLIAAITGTLMDRLRALAEMTAAMRDERVRLESEMAIAQRVQSAQLPAHVPSLEGMEVNSIYKPAREVGGDTYDFYPVEARRLGVMVADVSGKGVPAALLVAGAKYSIREHFSEDLAATVRDTSTHIASITGDDTFVTLTYGLLDGPSRQFRYVNAGGMPPIVVSRAASATTLHEHSDPPLGICDDADYSVRVISLEPGDTLVLYTDGLVDALGFADEGIQMLCRELVEINDLPPAQWREELLRRIDKPRHLDDVTVVAIRAE